MESLFSLEVIVNFVKLYNLKPDTASTTCLFPCIAFRLLDYPTIAISLLDDYETKEIRDKLKISQPFDQIEKLPCFSELLDKHGRYIFSKGKSCLFRAKVDSIRAHLRSTPLYLMLMDTFFEPYKLIGTVLVPLNNLINEIYDEISEQNSFTPSSKSVQVPCIKITHGVFDIKNLMGEEIGHVSFACRLTSFGTSLIPHIIQQKPVLKTNATREELENKKLQPQIESLALPESTTESEVHCYNLRKDTRQSSSTNTIKFSESAVVQTISIDYKDAQVQISKNEQSNKATQSSEAKRKFPVKELDQLIQVKHVQDEFVFNHYCPPFLKYNASSDRAKEKSEILTKHHSASTVENENNANDKVARVINERVVISKRIEYLKNAFENKENFDLDLNETQKEMEENSEEEPFFILANPVVSSRTHSNLNKRATSQQLQLNLNQLPLLNCLFEEISKLKGVIEDQNFNHFTKTRRSSVNSDCMAPELKQARSASAERDKKLVSKRKISSEKTKIRTSETGSKKHQPSRKQKNLVGILKTSRKDYDQRAIDEIVNRLTRPKSPRPPRESVSNTDYDEMPVRGPRNDSQAAAACANKKEPLKYGTTNTFRMRVAANNPKKAKDIDKKHNELLNQIRKSLEELNYTATSDQKSMQKNLEQALRLESTGTGSTSFLTTGLKSLTLLNKVEMESTIDTLNYQNLETLQSKMLRSEYLNEINAQEQQQSRLSNINSSTTKMVQFGNTYVYSTPDQISNESSAVNSSAATAAIKPRRSLERTSSENQSTSLASSLSASNDRNIFLENKKASRNSFDYEEDEIFSDSLSSSKMSSSTTSNFFTQVEQDKNRPSSSKSSYENKRSPRRSPRAFKSFENTKNSSKNRDNDDVENYDEDLEDLATNQTNRSDFKSSSKYTDQSYNSKSFVDESISSVKSLRN